MRSMCLIMGLVGSAHNLQPLGKTVRRCRSIDKPDVKVIMVLSHYGLAIFPYIGSVLFNNSILMTINYSSALNCYSNLVGI